MLGLDPKAPVLVVAAHHDDEVLGCGATIARLTEQGHPVTIAVLGEGAVCRDPFCSEQARRGISDRMQAQATQASAALGATFLQAGLYPDNEFDSVSLISVVRSVETVLDTVRPKAILTHHAGDLNVDHSIVNRAVQTASRPLPGRSVHIVLAFEVLSSTEWAPAGKDGAFAPTVFVDVSGHMERKLDALRIYGEEINDFPHARSGESVRSLAKVRGAASGLCAAEAFEVIRWCCL